MKDHRVLSGASLRAAILADVKRRVEVAEAPPRLVSISIGAKPEAAIYIRNQARAAAEVGLPFEDQHWQADLTQDECKKRLVAMNDDPGVLGVILQRPAPKGINIRSLQNAIHPFKDVEGMSPASIGNIVYNDLALAPCTAAASVELLKSTGLPLAGLEVVMIGHSEIVGKPVAFMLMAEGATVTVCHHMTAEAHRRRHDQARRRGHRYRNQPGDRAGRQNHGRRRCRH